MLHQHATSSSSVPHRPPSKKRGSYNCSHCGLPKKGHVCNNGDMATPPGSERPHHSLSFDDLTEETNLPPPKEEQRGDNCEVQLPVPATCMAEVLRRLSLKELMGAACVCRGWREVEKRVRYSVEEVRIKVNRCRSSIGFVRSVLNRCEGLVKLRLTMERLETDLLV